MYDSPLEIPIDTNTIMFNSAMNIYNTSTISQLSLLLAYAYMHYVACIIW